MSEIQPSVPAYALGYTPEAFQRLLVQGRLYRPFMRRLLEAAGLSAGMHVLDVGCGPGEVSLLAAELVGELGIVIGVDRDESTIRIAQGLRKRLVSRMSLSCLAISTNSPARSLLMRSSGDVS